MSDETFEPELEEVEPEDLAPDQVDPEVEGTAGYEEVENGDGRGGPDDFGPDLVSEEDQAG